MPVKKDNILALDDIGSFLEKLAENSEGVYWLSSPDFTKIQYISPAYEKIWGRSRKILYKQPELWITYLHPEDVAGYNPIQAMAERIVNEGDLARYQESYRIIRPDGEVRWIIDQGFPIYNSDGVCCGVTGVAVDVTKDKLAEEELRKEKEKAEAANKAKTEFLENMRHDIRTPLIGITGFAEIIKKESTDLKIKEYVDNLVASSSSLLNLLNEVLEAIAVSSGEIPLLKKKFTLEKKLNDVILLYQAKAAHKNIALSLYYDPAIPTYLLGDSTRIHRVILELVSNALNFTHKGHIKVSAQLAENNAHDVVIKIMVEDTGVGIPAEKQQEIYVQFKRLTPSYEGIYKGFGLGLSIAKQFIEDMNGELYVESQVGVGSTFTFIVPLKKPLLDEALGSEEHMPVSNGHSFISSVAPSILEQTAEITTGYKSRILLVEDSALAAKVVINKLSAMDCAVDLAENGKQGVALAEKKQYDLIFMDIGLPDIDGYEVTRRIRLSELRKAHVPIIALSAHTGEDNKKKCMDVGMNAVLTKPLQEDQARDILNSFIPYRREKLHQEEISPALEETIEYETLSAFDFELLKKQFSGKTEAAVEMIRSFLESLPEERREIQSAYEKKDWGAVKDLTHKFHGGVSYCAAPRLQKACTQLEKSIRKEKSTLFESCYTQLLDEIALAEKTMREELG